MFRKMFILICFFCLLLSKAQSEPALSFGDTVAQQIQKSGHGKDGEKRDGENGNGDDNSGSGGGDNSGSGGGNNSDDDGNGNSGSGSGDGNNSGGDNSGSGSGDGSGNGDNNGGDNGNSGSSNDGENNGNGGNGGSDNSNNGNSGGDGNGHSGSSNSGDDNSGKGKDDDEYERRYYVGAVSASDGTSVLMGGTRLESTSPWLEILSTGVWFEAYGYWQDNSFVAEDIKVLDNEAWSYFRGPASVVGVRAKGNVEVWTKTSGVDTRLTSEDQVRLVAYFDGTNYRSLPALLKPPTTNVPTGWVELTGSYDGQSIVWDVARAFP
jgi:hypothetical protein